MSFIILKAPLIPNYRLNGARRKDHYGQVIDEYIHHTSRSPLDEGGFHEERGALKASSAAYSGKAGLPRYARNRREQRSISGATKSILEIRRVYAIQYLAKRFAAKEALVKAIGTGFGAKISMRDITVKNDKMGKPYYDLTIEFDGTIKELFKIKKYSLHLSISDDKENAIANALIEA